MIHEELKLRVTTDVSQAIAELERLRGYLGENPPPMHVKIVFDMNTEASTKRIQSMALALSAAAQQVAKLEERLGRANQELAKVLKKAPKRPPRTEF